MCNARSGSGQVAADRPGGTCLVFQAGTLSRWALGSVSRMVRFTIVLVRQWVAVFWNGRRADKDATGAYAMTITLQDFRRRTRLTTVGTNSGLNAPHLYSYQPGLHRRPRDPETGNGTVQCAFFDQTETHPLHLYAWVFSQYPQAAAIICRFSLHAKQYPPNRVRLQSVWCR